MLWLINLKTKISKLPNWPHKVGTDFISKLYGIKAEVLLFLHKNNIEEGTSGHRLNLILCPIDETSLQNFTEQCF